MLLRRVSGRSMLPGLSPGSIIITVSRTRYHADDVVVARQGGREVVKRVSYFKGSHYFLIGDNMSESTDSRQLGLVHKDDILGSVVMKFKKIDTVTPPKVAHSNLLFVPYALIIIVTLMLLLQLYAIDKIKPLYTMAFGNDVVGQLALVLLILIELASLPFLLRLRTSYLARYCSILAGFLLPVLLAVYTAFSPNVSLGFFGSIVPIWGLSSLMLSVVIAVFVSVSYLTLDGHKVLRPKK